MTNAGVPAGRPVLGLAVIAGLLVMILAGVMIWQQARWVFASPLAVAFHQQEMDTDKVSVDGPEIRKFISLALVEADKLAKTGGFDCKGLTFSSSLVVCYRDIWTGLCSEIWSLELVYDDQRKITRANGRKRRTCL